MTPGQYEHPNPNWEANFQKGLRRLIGSGDLVVTWDVDTLGYQ